MSTSNDTLKTLLNNNGFEDFATTHSWDENNNYFQLEVFLYASQNSKLYNGFIEKMNNKYYFYDSTGVIATENTLEALIANTSVKNKLQTELNKVLLGTYSGNYSGDDSGTWNITINSDFSMFIFF